MVEDPYIRKQHQIGNFVRLCELIVRRGGVREVRLVTGYDDPGQKAEAAERLAELAESLKDQDIVLKVEFSRHLHDRAIRLDNGWVVKIGRGLDFYQPPQSWFEVGANDLGLRACLEASEPALTRHAAARMSARGVSLAAVRAVLAYGRRRYARGAELRVIGRKEVARFLRRGVDLRAYEGVHVVRSLDGDIITVYRNRDLRSLRPRSRRAGAGGRGSRPPLSQAWLPVCPIIGALH